MKFSRLLRFVRLPKPPIAMPVDGPFAVDSAGMAKPPTEEALMKARDALIKKMAPISKDVFWSMPIHEGLKYVARHSPYWDVADIVMKHSLFGLMEDMLLCPDAPLPHVIYTDLLQCKTFASLQSPMDEQFSLDASILRALLQMASFHLLHDAHYFASVEKLFRTIELQQTVGSEVLSAWVQCCVFAGKTALAIQALQRMEENKVPFDAEVFCSMMAPTSAGPRPDMKSEPSVRLAHQRLFTNMSASCSPSAVGIHACFVANSLLMRHAAKWEVLRMALTMQHQHAMRGGSRRVGVSVDVAHRTLDLAATVLELERGVRCGPKTSEALAVAFSKQHGTSSSASSVESLFKTLYYMRTVEALPEYKDEPMANFSEEAEAFITVTMKKAINEQPEVKLMATSSLYLLNHTAGELKHAVREDGPLARTLASPTDQFKFKELLAVMNFDKLPKQALPSDASLSTTQIDASRVDNTMSTVDAKVHSLPTPLVASSPAPIATESTSSLFSPSFSSSSEDMLMNQHWHGGMSRVAQQELLHRSREASAMARLHSAWMNPSAFSSPPE